MAAAAGKRIGIRAATFRVVASLGVLAREIVDAVRGPDEAPGPSEQAGGPAPDRSQLPPEFQRQGPPQLWLDYLATGEPVWSAGGAPESSTELGEASEQEEPTAAGAEPPDSSPALPRVHRFTPRRRRSRAPRLDVAGSATSAAQPGTVEPTVASRSSGGGPDRRRPRSRLVRLGPATDDVADRPPAPRPRPGRRAASSVALPSAETEPERSVRRTAPDRRAQVSRSGQPETGAASHAPSLPSKTQSSARPAAAERVTQPALVHRPAGQVTPAPPNGHHGTGPDLGPLLLTERRPPRPAATPPAGPDPAIATRPTGPARPESRSTVGQPELWPSLLEDDAETSSTEAVPVELAGTVPRLWRQLELAQIDPTIAQQRRR